jgi:ABC-type molybdate transport system permease subunit
LARKTIVSLVSPCRTFAVVEATTRNRVDLGLRLDDAVPAGRLQVARNMGGGGATMRIGTDRPALAKILSVRIWLHRGITGTMDRWTRTR